jgi:hypothetical protein
VNDFLLLDSLAFRDIINECSENLQINHQSFGETDALDTSNQLTIRPQGFHDLKSIGIDQNSRANLVATSGEDRNTLDSMVIF